MWQGSRRQKLPGSVMVGVERWTAFQTGSEIPPWLLLESTRLVYKPQCFGGCYSISLGFIFLRFDGSYSQGFVSWFLWFFYLSHLKLAIQTQIYNHTHL